MNRMGRKNPWPSSTWVIPIVALAVFAGFAGFVVMGGMG